MLGHLGASFQYYSLALGSPGGANRQVNHLCAKAHLSGEASAWTPVKNSRRSSFGETWKVGSVSVVKIPHVIAALSESESNNPNSFISFLL